MTTTTWRWLHAALTIVLAGVIVVCGSLIGAGVLRVGFGPQSAAPPEPQPMDAKVGGQKQTGKQDAGKQEAGIQGPKIERADLPPVCWLLHEGKSGRSQTRLYKYTGAWIDCRVEVEEAGKWVVRYKFTGKEIHGTNDALRWKNEPATTSGQGVVGYVLLQWHREGKQVLFRMKLSGGGAGGTAVAVATPEFAVLNIDQPEGDKSIIITGDTDVATLPRSLDKDVILFDAQFYWHEAKDTFLTSHKHKVRVVCQPWTPNAAAGR